MNALYDLFIDIFLDQSHEESIIQQTAEDISKEQQNSEMTGNS